MKRFLVTQVRQNKDKDTGDDLMFISLFRLPSRMKNGGLFYPKKEDREVTACLNKTKKPEEYQKFLNLLPGSLVDVTFGINDFNEKTFVAGMQLVGGTNVYTDDILFV